MNKDTQNKDKQNEQGEQDGNGNQQTNDDSGGKQESNTETISMTQDRFNEIIAERVQRAKTSATSDFVSMLEVDNVEQAKAIIEADKLAKQAEMSELEKAQARNTALQSDISKRQTEYNAVLVNNAVMLAAPNLKIPSERIPALLKLMNTDAIKVDANGVPTGAEEEIKRVIDENPFILFTDGKNRLDQQGNQTDKGNKLKDALKRVNDDDGNKRRKRLGSI